MELTSAKRRVLERLKRVDDATVAELAADLELTGMAVRLHLVALEAEDWVDKVPSSCRGPLRGQQAGQTPARGRPAASWRLTPAADALFEDRHAELTVDLIATLRATLGKDALQQVIDARGARQVAAYRRRTGVGSVGKRLRALATIRSNEGYRAEVQALDDDAWLLIEHHCPICEAAKACGGLCASERAVFQAVLGKDVTVERVQHLLSGDRRCVYRISPA